MDNTCVCCGVIIPEGRMVCPICLATNFDSIEYTEKTKGDK